MSARGRIVDVKYDRRLAHLHLTYENGTESEVDLLKFGNLPFEFAESRAKKMERFEISAERRS